MTSRNHQLWCSPWYSAGSPGISLSGHAQCSGKGLECSLNDVMGVASSKLLRSIRGHRKQPAKAIPFPQIAQTGGDEEGSCGEKINKGLPCLHAGGLPTDLAYVQRHP